VNWDDHAGYYAEGDYKEMLFNAVFQDICRDSLLNGDEVAICHKPRS